VARLLILLTFPFDCGPDSASRGALGKHGCRLMPSRRPADPVRIRASRARAPEVPSDRKSHRRPSLIHGGHIERQATRPARGALAIARPTFASDLTCGLAGGAKLHRPDGAGRSSASFQGGDFEGSKNLDPEKIRCSVSFPSGGIARICVGRHSGIDAHSDTWHQRAGADVPNG